MISSSMSFGRNSGPRNFRPRAGCAGCAFSTHFSPDKGGMLSMNRRVCRLFCGGRRAGFRLFCKKRWGCVTGFLLVNTTFFLQVRGADSKESGPDRRTPRKFSSDTKKRLDTLPETGQAEAIERMDRSKNPVNKGSRSEDALPLMFSITR